MDKRVSIVKCDSYAETAEKVHKALELLGGIEAFVKPGDKVVIKPNYVSRKNPADAATTHPEFLRAVIVEAENAGGSVVVAESPGGPYSRAMLGMVYSGCGADEAVKGTGASLNYDTDFREKEFPAGHTVKKFTVIDPILEADVIISLPKLKTHSMTSYTGAVKNMFGVIPGTHKAEMHFRLNERAAFCSMLVDLCECVTPHLSIMDGVWAMEGNGPTAGENRKAGLIIAAKNPFALDLAASSIIGYAPHEVDTVLFSAQRGLCPESAAELTVLGERLEDVMMPDFKKPESHFDLLKLLPVPSAMRAWLTEKLSARPKIDYDMCVGCGECARCCPPKAIDMKEHRPHIRREACIKCFCCQELCPKKAVKIERSVANRLMLRLLK